MKRAISTFFIALVSVAILAHAVIPHHHHNKVFAAVVNILDSDYQVKLHHDHDPHSHHHTIPVTHHHHDESGNSEECLINESCVAPVRVGDDNSRLLPDLQAFDLTNKHYTVNGYQFYCHCHVIPWMAKPSDRCTCP